MCFAAEGANALEVVEEIMSRELKPEIDFRVPVAFA